MASKRAIDIPLQLPRLPGNRWQLWFRLQGCVDWLLAGPLPLPDDIRNELLQQHAD